MRSLWCSCIALLLIGCGSDGEDRPEQKSHQPGITPNASNVVLATEPYEIAPGDERFVCYAKTLQEDAVISDYHYSAKPGMHHFVLARTMAPEPDGVSECDVLFKPTWNPLFIATTADADLKIPEGAANVIPAGTQLLIQLHLLNSTNELIREQAVVEMRRSPLENPREAGLYVFGSTDIDLPPQQSSQVTANCTARREVKFFAMLPHMHYLGRGLRIEAGPDENSLTTVFENTTYDFDNQELSKFDFTLPAGHHTRTTCMFDNPNPEAVKFGESSTTEMCFGIGFALDVKGASGCITGSGREYPRDPAAGECADVVPNELGVGKRCTKGGGECPEPLGCSADLTATANGMCLKLGCSTSADCGGGSATCCQQSITTLCMPEACRPLSCAPQP